MSRRPDQLLVAPLFYDALSVEASPPSDPQGRKHTLGRLAFATFAEGEFTTHEEAGQTYAVFSYRPSWASHVLSEAGCRVNSGAEEVVALDRLQLTDNEGRSLSYAYEELAGTQVIHIATATGSMRNPLALGDPLMGARELVAHTAQGFFDRAR